MFKAVRCQNTKTVKQVHGKRTRRQHASFRRMILYKDLRNYNQISRFLFKSWASCYKLLVNHCRINVRKHFFSERIIKVWNSLPPSIVSFKSLLSFRNSLGNVNLGLYTKYWSLFFNLFLLPMYIAFSLRLICVLLLYACICRLCGM